MRTFTATRKDRSAKAPTARKTGAVIYCRVSTKDQLENFSIETQEKACRDYCERNGYRVLRVFREAASAKTSNSPRPEFQAMLAHCRKHSEDIGAVVIYAISRLLGAYRTIKTYGPTCEHTEYGYCP